MLGSIMNSVYLSQIVRLRYVPQISHLPAQVLDAINLGVQEAHIAAQSIPDPRMAQIVTDAANAAFVSGMAQAMLVGAVVLVVASALAFALLPVTVRPVEATTSKPVTAGDHLVTDEKSQSVTQTS